MRERPVSKVAKQTDASCVLVVEDDAIVRMFIVSHLLDEGYLVKKPSLLCTRRPASDKRGIHRYRIERGKCREARFYLSHTFPATLSNPSNGGLRNLLFWHKADIRIGRLHRLLLIQSGHS